MVVMEMGEKRQLRRMECMTGNFAFILETSRQRAVVQTYEFWEKNQRPTLELFSLCKYLPNKMEYRKWKCGVKRIFKCEYLLPYKHKLCQMTQSTNALRVRMIHVSVRWVNEWAADRYEWKQKANNNKKNAFWSNTISNGKL